jgi:hypothetical protein
LSLSLGRAGIWAGAAIATAFSLLLAVAVPAAPPTLTVVATDAVIGQTIDATADLSEGPTASGEISFEVFGPDDPTCAGPALESSQAPVSGEGQYASADFTPTTVGLYYWSARYPGDAENPAAEAPCAAISTVAKASPGLIAAARAGVVGTAIRDEATVTGGFSPTGEVAFSVFAPADMDCSTPLATSSSALESGRATSADFFPQQAGEFRWTAAYSGDLNNAPATSGCGKVASSVARAKPTIAGAVPRRLSVGTPFQDTATLQGAYAPGGTVTFRIYGPIAGGCAKPAFVNTVAVAGNGTVSSDPFVARSPGRYSFVVSYSGDAANQAATEPCDSAGQVVRIRKRAPKVKPRARLVGRSQIAIRARLSGGASPSGALTFRLYGPGDERCSRKPAFSGGVTVESNGTFSLARYIATEVGVYRLSVGYSGDRRNQRYTGGCDGAQPIRVGKPS